MGFPVQGRGKGNPLPFGLNPLPFGLKPERLKRKKVENRHPSLDHPNPEGWCDLFFLYRLHYLYVSLGVYLPFFSSVFLSVFSSVFLCLSMYRSSRPFSCLSFPVCLPMFLHACLPYVFRFPVSQSVFIFVFLLVSSTTLNRLKIQFFLETSKPYH